MHVCLGLVFDSSLRVRHRASPGEEGGAQSVEKSQIRSHWSGPFDRFALRPWGSPGHYTPDPVPRAGILLGPVLEICLHKDPVM